jgi:membrane-bound metal-dependent hydrolase YbcI (DUF457 family)
MGPGILFKSLLQGSFSLMVFGWTQIVMDIQPLLVMITGEGHLHGFSHTYLGASLLAIVAALSGKYLSQVGLYLLRIESGIGVPIAWWVVFLSAFVGAFSHVLIDSIMHADMAPFYPFSQANDLLFWVSIETLHKVCLYAGLLGAAVYYLVQWWLGRRLASRG